MLIAIVSIFFARDNSVFAALLLLLLLVISFAATLSASKILSCTILKGIPSVFQLELPPYRKPNILAVIKKSLRDRALFVLLRALIIAAPAGCIIWMLSHITINGQMPIVLLAQLLEPAARPFGMDGIILLAFLLGWPANEIVIPLMLMLYLSTGSMVELESYATLHQILSANGWTWQTAASVLLFTLFHWPCSTTCLTIYKETGSTGWTLLAIVLPAVIGFLFCFVLQMFFQLAGV
jgi:ferrous iron transport protein B